MGPVNVLVSVDPEDIEVPVVEGLKAKLVHNGNTACKCHTNTDGRNNKKNTICILQLTANTAGN